MMPKLLFFIWLTLLCATPTFARDYQHVAPIQRSHDAEKWADKTLHKLSLEEKIGQMFMLRAQAEFLIGPRNAAAMKLVNMSVTRVLLLFTVRLPMVSRRRFYSMRSVESFIAAYC